MVGSYRGWVSKELRWWDEALEDDGIELGEWAAIDGYEDYGD